MLYQSNKHYSDIENIQTPKLNETSVSKMTVQKSSTQTNSSVIQEIYDRSNQEPNIIVPINNIEVFNGEIVLFICEFSCLSDQHEVDWFHQNQLISPSKSNIKTTRTAKNIYRSVLTIFQAQKTHEGTYTCQIKNVHGLTSTTATLSLSGKVNIRKAKFENLINSILHFR
jgi:hypothetical protein